MSVQLAALEPFARGGNRLCFIHPQYPDRCIKVQRPDFSVEERRRRKGFPKRLRPLDSFDDNLQEYKEITLLDRLYQASLYEHVSRCFGFESTDMGKGLVSELIRDADQKISHTLKQYIFDHGFNDTCQQAVAEFSSHWLQLAVPSRDLLLHNIVVQRNSEGQIQRLVIIDGIGSSGLIPYRWWPRSIRVHKAQRKLDDLRSRIKTLLLDRNKGTFPGHHGRLFHDGVTPPDQSH